MSREFKARARALARTRAFFDERRIYEVDTPSLSPLPALDAYIDPIGAEGGYLHTSPEYEMKKMIADGSGDIYYLGHVFRKEEIGRLHNSEFTMIEYYRVGKSLDFLIDESIELISTFLGSHPITQMSYEEALSLYGAPHDTEELAQTSLSPQELTHLTWATHVEPKLEGLTVITPFPASEAALSKVVDGQAMRFEIYYEGIELANGYDELNCSEEQKKRFIEANMNREGQNKGSLPIDETFLAALDQLPPCVGVAIGFDRLLQIELGAPSIHDILAHSKPKA